MIIMSVDLGKARTGIALSDSGESFAFPKTVITEYNTEKLVKKIAALSGRAQECKEIAERIAKESGKETVLWDERCTTVSAHTALNYTDTRGKKRKEVIDAVAAVIILEDYLKFRKNNI